MKKIILSILLISIFLVGCTKKEENKIESKEEVSKETVKVSGGWTYNMDTKNQELSDKTRQIFNNATNGYVGVGFEPTALLGTQVVSGINYMFLCKGTSTLNPTPLKLWYIVVIYNDLEGNASIIDTKEFEIKDYTNDEEKDNIVGGWSLNKEYTNTLDDEINSIFMNTSTSNYTPIALIGTQVVAGTNYAILAFDNTNESLNLLTIYNDLEGNSTLTNTYKIDITELKD